MEEDHDHEHDNTDSSLFCLHKVDAIVMQMSGIRSSLFASNSDQAHCLNLFFREWTLDDTWKFVLAMIFVFVVSFFAESISVLQRKWFNRCRCQEVDEEGKSTIAISLRHQKIILALFYGIQASVYYMLMLVIMTYSLELILSVLIGVVSGFLVFQDEGVYTDENYNDNEGSNALKVAVFDRVVPNGGVTSFKGSKGQCCSSRDEID